MEKIKDIAMWEETDSELAKYNIHKLYYDNKHLKSLLKHIEQEYIEFSDRIDKAIDYCEDIISREIDISDTDYELGEDSVARDILKILRGENENNS